MAVVSTMVAIAQAIPMSVPVAVVAVVSIRLSVSLPLVQPVDVLERVTAGVELADAVSGAEVAQTVDVVVGEADTDTVSVLGLSLPLVQPVDVLERVTGGVELADAVAGAEVAQTVDVVVGDTNSDSVSVRLSRPLAEVVRSTPHSGSDVRGCVAGVSRYAKAVAVVRLRLPLADPVVGSAAKAGGLDSVSNRRRPGRSHTARTDEGVSEEDGGVSLRGGEGSRGQA